MKNPMRPSLSRRDFLKLSSLLSLLAVPLPRKAIKTLSGLGAPVQKNVLIFVFDALSATHLPIYGYARNTTPNLSRFAERATVYHSHYAGGNFTTPGTASLLTGVYPWTHRAINLYGTVLEAFKQRNLFSAYPGSGFSFSFTHNLLADTLLEQFRSSIDLFKRPRDLSIHDPEYSDRLFPKDYDVSLWSEQLILRGAETKPSSLFGSLLYRFLRLGASRRIADKYGRQFPLGVPNQDDIYFVLEDAVNWLVSELPQARTPYLGYFHVLPPHEPYDPRKDFAGLFQDDYQPISKPTGPFSQGYPQEVLNQNRMRYDEYLAYADAEFGRWYDAMHQKGALENTTVIVTADHGELFERGILGHQTEVLYDPVVRVPLLISSPGQSERVDIHSHTSCTDVVPTVAKLTGQTSPEWVEGQVLPGFRDQAVQDDRSVYVVEAKSSPKQGRLVKLSAAVVKGDYKLIYYRGYPNAPEAELYDVANDPEELNDLKSAKASVAADLQNELETRLRETNSF
jgi:arylsulfatase A-like enzyme